MTERTRPVWRKSSRSNASGDCVEAADLGDTVAVRDSKDPRGPVLTFGAESFRAFIDDVRTGAFDPR